MKAYPQADYLREALRRARSVSAEGFVAQGLSGKAIGEALAAEQTRLLDDMRK